MLVVFRNTVSLNDDLSHPLKIYLTTNSGHQGMKCIIGGGSEIREIKVMNDDFSFFKKNKENE